MFVPNTDGPCESPPARKAKLGRLTASIELAIPVYEFDTPGGAGGTETDIFGICGGGGWNEVDRMIFAAVGGAGPGMAGPFAPPMPCKYRSETRGNPERDSMLIPIGCPKILSSALNPGPVTLFSRTRPTPG